MLSTFTQWTNAQAFLAAAPGWVKASRDPNDQFRVMAYALYEQMYWNTSEAFGLIERGADTEPIYLPFGKTLINAVHRYLAVDWDYVLDSRFDTPQNQAIVQAALDNLFRREGMYGKVNRTKKYGLIRGDALFHVIADPTKPQGSRLSIIELDPGSYFPILDPDDPTSVIGCHIASLVTPAGLTTQYVRRRTYRKVVLPNGTVQITSELALWDQTAWDDRATTDPAAKVPLLFQQLVPPFVLPPAITSIPVYSLPNEVVPGQVYGCSILRGLEALISSVDQAVSDEDLTLAMQGLGLYVTDSSAPTDSNGNETNWQLGPGRVVEVDEGTTFSRTSGVTSVQPFQDHVKLLQQSAQSSLGIGDIALGNVVATAQVSGIALYIQLSPLLQSNVEREAEMLAVYDHLLYDLIHGWLPAYEQLNPGQVVITASVGDPTPTVRTEKIAELINLVKNSIISAEYARTELNKMGYTLDPDTGNVIVNEQAALAQAQLSDPFAERLRQELLLEEVPDGVVSGSATVAGPGGTLVPVGATAPADNTTVI